MQHISTGYISPQFNLVFYDLFDTVICQLDDDITIEAIYSDICGINLDWYAEEDFDDAGNIIYWPPPLHDVWLDERGRHDRKQELERQRKRIEDRLRERNQSILEIITLNTKDDDYFSPRGAPISDDELSVDYSVG